MREVPVSAAPAAAPTTAPAGMAAIVHLRADLPVQGVDAGPAAAPDTHHRSRRDRIDHTGTASLRRAGRCATSASAAPTPAPPVDLLTNDLDIPRRQPRDRMAPPATSPSTPTTGRPPGPPRKT